LGAARLRRGPPPTEPRTLPIFLSEVKAWFRAEFINRVDEQIVFRPLSEEDARRGKRNEERGMRKEE